MTLLSDVAKELVGMFISDARLTLAVLLLVVAVAAMLGPLHMAPLLCGAVLLLGCLLIVVGIVTLEAARRRT